ncbi:MAG: glycosyltransferase family 9 protein [Bacteroidaceae bacterium]|nr:glycosyltransferase family 9 protein [Bacteroidaceae bacterium]
MGDVLMTVPVIDSFARQHPDVRVTVVSRAWAKPVFDLLPKNVHFLAADLRGKHAGYKGLNLLARRLFALQPTHVADLHDVLRTKWLRLRMRTAGIHVAHIHKDRHARKEFLTAEEPVPQTTSFEKYADVFRQLGFDDWTLDFRSLYPHGLPELAEALPHFDVTLRPEPYWIAVAPFSAHDEKTYPPELMEQVVQQLDARGDTRIFLFGAGKEELPLLQSWAERYPHVECAKESLHHIGEELLLIAHCRAMLSMDSGNMHLASLVGVPVVSIWGATHPFAGFYGYGQDFEDAVQRDDLPCRPCSIYGNKPCQYEDCRCLTGIAPADIVKKVIEKSL